MKKIAVLLAAVGCLFVRSALGITDIITNGGFETSPETPPWQFSGVAGVPVVSVPLLAHTGNNFLSMGSANGVVNQSVYQSVQIPTNAMLALFTYWWDTSSSQDPAGSVEFQSLAVHNGNQTVLDTEYNGLNFTNGYAPITVDLSPFAGQTVLVGFFLQATTAGFGVRTSFSVDDVTLQIFTASDIPPNDNFTNATLLVTTTNISVLGTNLLATKEVGEPKHSGVTGGHSIWWKWTAPANGSVVLNTDNSTFNTVLGVYTGASVNNLTQIAADDDENTGRGQLTSQVHFLVTAGTEYEFAVDGKGGASGIVQLNLSFSADTQPPKVAIKSPKSKSQVTDSTVAINGTASDNLAVASVQFRLENAAGTNDYQNASGSNNWSGTVTGLIPGPNIIRVRAFDTSSNESASVISTVTYVVVSPLTVAISGTGTVSPNLNNTMQDVGGTLKLTAKPGAGQVFGGWSGDVDSATAVLTFVMKSNMVVQANFVPNPFTPVVGSYQGLFYDINGPTHASSGSINAKVTGSGSFSAKVLLAGKSYSLSGQFSAGGFASNSIVRKGLTPVSAQLNLDLAGGGVTGVFSDGTFTSELNAHLVTTTPGDIAGKYTLLIPGSTNIAGHPGGDSYGTVVVSTKGAVSLSGVLADGTKLAQKANLLTTGQWPLYVALYKGNGSILGWMTFSNGVINGTVDWFKLPAAGGKLYPAGFTNGTEAVGSSYVFTKGVPVLDLAPGQLWLANGNLADGLTNEITLDSASKITSTNNALKLTITTGTGLFKGTIANPAGGKPIAINGVVLQRQNTGGGFFTGTTETGRVFLGPVPVN